MAFNSNSTFTGLTTMTVGIPTAGAIEVKGKLELPTIDQGAPANSQVVVTITQTPTGGSPTTIYTGLAGAKGFRITVNAAALDAIAVTTSSAATVDQGLNVIKTTLSVG